MVDYDLLYLVITIPFSTITLILLRPKFGFKWDLILIFIVASCLTLLLAKFVAAPINHYLDDLHWLEKRKFLKLFFSAANEEVVKTFPALILFSIFKEKFKRPYDVVYSFLIPAVSFSAIENYNYLIFDPLPGFFGFFFRTFGHSSYGFIFGYCFSLFYLYYIIVDNDKYFKNGLEKPFVDKIYAKYFFLCIATPTLLHCFDNYFSNIVYFRIFIDLSVLIILFRKYTIAKQLPKYSYFQ